jgi:hypothetical protein
MAAKKVQQNESKHTSGAKDASLTTAHRKMNPYFTFLIRQEKNTPSIIQVKNCKTGGRPRE